MEQALQNANDELEARVEQRMAEIEPVALLLGPPGAKRPAAELEPVEQELVGALGSGLDLDRHAMAEPVGHGLPRLRNRPGAAAPG